MTARLGGMRGLAVAALLLTACAQAPAPSEAPPDHSTPPSQHIDAADPPSAAPTERPVSASDLLECDGPVSPIGGWADDFGPAGGGETPEEAFATWVDESPFSLPRTGYRELGSTGDRWLYAYEVGGRTKIVIVISARFGEFVGERLTIEELRTCDPSEYGAMVDLGPGTRVWAHLETGAILTDIPGSSHCGWESARLLHLSHPDGTLDRQYVRDPDGVLPAEPLLDRYQENVSLPPDAFDSGYRSADGLAIWFTESDLSLYVVGDGVAERWPRAREPIGCA